MQLRGHKTLLVARTTRQDARQNNDWTSSTRLLQHAKHNIYVMTVNVIIIRIPGHSSISNSSTTEYVVYTRTYDIMLAALTKGGAGTGLGCGRSAMARREVVGRVFFLCLVRHRWTLASSSREGDTIAYSLYSLPYSVYRLSRHHIPQGADFPRSLSPLKTVRIWCRCQKAQRWKRLAESFPKTHRIRYMA